MVNNEDNELLSDMDAVLFGVAVTLVLGSMALGVVFGLTYLIEVIN